MPSTRTRRTRGRIVGSGGFTETEYLFYSLGAFFDAEDYETGKTKEELKAFWMKHRSAIMARYLEENRAKGPGWEGIRPWAFWELEDREPRRKTTPKEFSSQRVWDHQRRVHDWVETDIAYLRCLNLLAPWELAALPELSEA